MADAQFFTAGLLWPINYAFCCCWTTFTLEMMVLCTMQPCLPLTEHVQTLFTLNWACANSVLGMCRHNWPCLTLFLTVLIDNYDSNLTLSQTQTHWVYHLHISGFVFWIWIWKNAWKNAIFDILWKPSGHCEKLIKSYENLLRIGFFSCVWPTHSSPLTPDPWI